MGYITEKVRRLYLALSECPDLTPGDTVDPLFRELVALASQVVPEEAEQAMLADPLVQEITPGLRRLCSAGETELERSWARRVTDSPEPGRTLREFPYFENYAALARLELHAAVGLCSGVPSRMLFIGAGPLPMSSILLSGHFSHTEIDNLDRDETAVVKARRLAAALRVDRMRFIAEDILSYDQLESYGIIWLAALVGMDLEDKHRILEHLAEHMAPGALLIARGAHGLRTLLYPQLPVSLLEGFRPLAVLRPYNDIVNSVVLAEKSGRRGDK